MVSFSAWFLPYLAVLAPSLMLVDTLPWIYTSRLHRILPAVFISLCRITNAVNAYSSGILDVIELSFLSCDELLAFSLEDFPLGSLAEFNFISIYAPSISIIYSNNAVTLSVLSKLQTICDFLNDHFVGFHPDTIADRDVLSSFSMPITIENIDIRKKSGITISEFERISAETRYSFVLDLEHVYGHVLLQNSDNRGSILRFYRSHDLSRYPTISKSILFQNYRQEIKVEFLSLTIRSKIISNFLDKTLYRMV